MPHTAHTVLALDSGSPTVSVAAARRGRVLARQAVEIGQSSQRLLGMIDEVLAAADLELRQLSGIVALRGPGSFTGLRVGLATVLGLHQATGIPGTALPTLQILAALVPAEGPRPVAVVDALRDEWFVQPFRRRQPPAPPEPVEEPERLPTDELGRLRPCTLVGFSVGTLRSRLPARIELLEPEALAPAAAELASRFALDWDPDALTRPLYLRGAAVTTPRG